MHPNSHASIAADLVSADTAAATLRALRAHGLLTALVRELTTPTLYGTDGESGDVDLTEKLTRYVTPRASPSYQPDIAGLFLSLLVRRLLHMYVSEKDSLRTLLDAWRAAQGGGELRLGADERQRSRARLPSHSNV